MILRKCILTHNDCYKAGRTITPKGVMVHSTGANNPNLRRYVQPDDGVLGANQSNNHWNKSGVQKCVHAFIGRTADGTVAVYQTLPWNHRGWHCGSKANNTHISFEICEDGLEDDGYFRQVYQAAAELTAYLCRKYKLDPLADGVVIDHHEGYLRGIASGHADVSHWFPRHGKSMDDFRADVARRLKEEDEDVTQEQFNGMMDEYLKQLAHKEPSDWSQNAREWAEETGLIKGDAEGNKQYKGFVTREQMVTFMQRLHDMN